MTPQEQQQEQESVVTSFEMVTVGFRQSIGTLFDSMN